MEKRVSKNPDRLTAATRRLKPAARKLRDDAWRYRAMMEFAAYGWTQASMMAEQVVALLSRREDGTLGVASGEAGPTVCWWDEAGVRAGPHVFFGLVERIKGAAPLAHQRGPKRPTGNWASAGAFA